MYVIVKLWPPSGIFDLHVSVIECNLINHEAKRVGLSDYSACKSNIPQEAIV